MSILDLAPGSTITSADLFTADQPPKFQRIYSLAVQQVLNDVPVPNLFTYIYYPLTIDIDVKQHTFMTTAEATFRIYNLSAQTRNTVFHDFFDTALIQGIALYAGYLSGIGATDLSYENVLPTIFQGNVQSAYSYRRGSDWITEIVAFGGAYGAINGQANVSYGAGQWNMQSLIRTLMATMPGTTIGGIGNFITQPSRGVSLYGNSYDLIYQLIKGQNGKLFFNGNSVNAILNTEYLQPAGLDLFLINASSGLLNTPKRYGKNICEVTMMFEPRIQPGTAVDVSSLDGVSDGLWLVQAISHRGRISGTMDGGMITTLSLYRPGTTIMTPVLAPAVAA